MIVGTNWPHVPWPEKSSFSADSVQIPATHLDTKATRNSRAQYAQAVANADRDLGLVYDAARRKLGEDVFFLFTADHGAQWPFGKWNCYDDGIRSPMIAVWPGKIAAGSQSSAMVSWIDLLPTFLDAASGKVPGDFDGRSFLSVLRGEVKEHSERIYTTHSGDGRMNEYPMRSVRTRDWKYIRNLDPAREHHTHIDQSERQGYWDSWVVKAKTDAAAAAVVDRYHRRPAEELYDLRSDPNETRNLATQPENLELLKQLGRDLDEWMKSQGDQGLATRPPTK